jgi:uncharacterized metal-binding protein YceD (DUF177 family)
VSGGEWRVVVQLAKLSPRPQDYPLVAPDEARAALAARFGLESIDRLEGALSVVRAGAGARASGRLVAEVVQSCVVSGEPVPAHVEEALELTFEPIVETGDEVELDPHALDVMPVEGDAIDLGEALAQALAVALDPYPRASPEVLARARRLLLSEEEAEAEEAAAKAAANPFAALKRP